MNTNFVSTTTTSMTTTSPSSPTSTTSVSSVIAQPSVAQKTYKEALENFKQHIENLANPFLVEDILNKLGQLCKQPISAIDGIVDSFSDLILPS